MNTYRSLNNQSFTSEEYSLVPIRFKDRFDIMKWRNEQIYHLRQAKQLTAADQNDYFEKVISQLFDKEQPDQLLFSFLKENKCIGYGGLVHINWNDKHAEISFIMDSLLEKSAFSILWSRFLDLICNLAFEELNFHKIFTYAFDLRKNLYTILENNGFQFEAKLKEHVLFEGKMIDVLIHSKLNRKPKLHNASLMDLQTTYDWSNNEIIRKHAFSSKKIEFENHNTWFNEKLASSLCHYYILKFGSQPIGSVRLDLDSNYYKKEGVISFLIDPDYHRLGIGGILLKLLEDKLINDGIKNYKLIGLVKNENIASLKIFRKLNYIEELESESIMRFSKII
jgi:RimJ/RimL family protein N-acetyltransferase